MSYDFTWRWAKGFSVADVTSMKKPKRGWNGMDRKYNGIGGKIPIELHALGSGIWRAVAKDSDIYVNL